MVIRINSATNEVYVFDGVYRVRVFTLMAAFSVSLSTETLLVQSENSTVTILAGRADFSVDTLMKSFLQITPNNSSFALEGNVPVSG